MLRAAPRGPNPACRQRRERMVRIAETCAGARALGAAVQGFEAGLGLLRRSPSASLARHIRRLEREHEARADPLFPLSAPPAPRLPAVTEHDR